MSKENSKSDKLKKKSPKKAVKNPAKKLQKKQPEATPAYEFKIRKTSGPTIGEIEKLRKKDPEKLTAHEKIILERANEQLLETVKIISKMYDPAPIAKMVNDAIRPIALLPTFPMADFAKIQNMMIANQAAMAKQIVAATNINFIASSMFADIHSARMRVLKSISINLSSLGRIQVLSDFETQATEIIDINEEDGQVTLEGNVSRTQTVQEFGLDQSAKLDIILTELISTRTEVKELREQVNSGKQLPERIEKADMRFQRQEAQMTIGQFKIPISRTSKQAIFCEVFFNHGLRKIWTIDDFVEEAFQERINPVYPESYWLNRLRSYIYQLNKSIALHTKGSYDDFFMLDNFQVSINEKYISHL